MKLLFTVLIIYFAYKILFKPKQVPPSRQNGKINNKKKASNKGEYIDYEEVD